MAKRGRKPKNKNNLPEKQENKYEFAIPDEKTWGLLKVPAEQRQMFMQICVALNLNPYLGHLQVLGGKLYITNPGLKHIASRSNRLDGIEIEKPVFEENEWHATAKVWLKDCKFPFTEHGHAGAHNVSSMLKGKFEEEMAKTRALNRALRMAFDVGLCSAEELPTYERVEHNITPPKVDNGANGKVDDKVDNKHVDVNNKVDNIPVDNMPTEKQMKLKQLMAQAIQQGRYTKEQLKEVLGQEGVVSATELTDEQLDKLIKIFEGEIK